MLTKYTISGLYNIFWDNESEDKPHSDFFKTVIWDELDDFINITSPTTANIIRKNIGMSQGHNFFKVFNNSNLTTVYYLRKSVEYIGDDYTKFNLDLDIWATFCMDKIDVINESFQFVRTPLLNENAFLYNDPLTQNIPIVYDSEEETIILEPVKDDVETGNYVYDHHPIPNQAGYIINVPKINSTLGNLYYVFKGIKNNLTYECFPLLNTTTNSTLSVFTPNGGGTNHLRNSWSWDSGHWNSGHATSIKRYNEFMALNTLNINNLNISTEFTNLYYWQLEVSNPALWTISYHPHKFKRNVNYNGVYQATVSVGVFKQLIHFKQDLEGTLSGIYTEHFNVENTEVGLEKLKNSAEYVNKFMGIYFLPNFAKFNKTPKVIGNCLYQEMEAKGHQMVLDLGKIEINTTLPTIKNQEYFNNIKMLRYYNISYYGNLKNWNYYLNEAKDRILFNSLFVFNGNGIFLGTSPYEKTKESIIEIPAQLPSATDDYIKMYSANMSSVNTGLQQMKEQQAHALANNAFDSIQNIGTGIATAAVNPAAGALAIANGVGGMFRKGGEITRATRHAKERMRATYEDSKRVNGTSFATTLSADASYIHTNFKINVSAGEVIEWAYPSIESMRILNNVNYYYGEYCPTFLPFKDVINSFTDFGYIQLDAENLNMTAISTPAFSDMSTEYRNYFFNQLEKGIRLWKKSPSKINEEPKPVISI